jgi:hypothetical protein
MSIKFADRQIDEAQRRLASIHRESADLQRQLRRGTMLGLDRALIGVLGPMQSLSASGAISPGWS